MQLKDMKVKIDSSLPVTTKAEKKEHYPYGLEVRLEKEALEKLGLEPGDFEIGSTGTLVGGYKVTGLSQNKSEDYNSKCVTLQIQKLGIKGTSDKGKSIEEALEDSKADLRIKAKPKKT